MPATTVDLIVRGGQVVTASEAYEASVAIRGEKIVAIGPDDLLPPADRYIDASGKFVLPGAIDCHVHLGGHDDYRIGGIAAAHARLTTIIPFAMYDLAHRETLPQSIKRQHEEVGKVSVSGKPGTHFRALSQEGRHSGRLRCRFAHSRPHTDARHPGGRAL